MRRQGISSWTLVALAAATLALGGCGRKGGLDLPPQAGVAPSPDVAQSQVSSAPNAGTIFDPGYRAEPPPEAQVRADRAKRGFILDPLLGN